MAVVAFNTKDRFAGYSAVSILLHWLTAIAVVVLYFTLEDSRVAVHMGIAIQCTPLFLFHIGWRVARGNPRPADQPPVLNLAAGLVKIGFMISLLALILTGMLLPGFNGEPLLFFGLAEFTIPLRQSRTLAQISREIHEIAGYALLPLLTLHVADALKRHFVDKDGALRRMFVPVEKGQ